jgi:hypothetical protein
MKNRLVFFGFMLLGITGGGLVGANLAAPSVAFGAETQPASTTQMRALIDAMQIALVKSPSKNPDRAYLQGMTTIGHIVVAVCKKEIDDGTSADVKAEATHILTVEQEYEARTRDLEREYGIIHE